MSTEKKWNILFIKEDKSMLNSDTEVFNQVFHKVDKVQDKEEALKYFNENEYDIVINDISIEAIEGLIFFKQMKDIKPNQAFFALVSVKDTDKLYLIADLGVNAFELAPEYFDEALMQIGKFNPYLEEK